MISKQEQKKEAFAHKRIVQKTLGSQMKILREKEQISCSVLSKKAHVRDVYVKALEDGRFDDLPARVYVRGFLQSIARVLSVSPHQLIAMYDREYSIQKSLQNKIEYVPVYGKQKHVKLYNTFFSANKLKVAVVVIMVVSAVTYLSFSLFSFIGEPFLTIYTPEDHFVTQDANIEIAGAADPTAVVRVNDEEVIVGRDGQFSTRVFLGDGNNTIVVRAENRFEKITEESISVVFYNSVEIATDNAVNEKEIRDNVTLRIRVENQRTWLSIDVDGETVLAKTVDVDYEGTFEGREIRVTSGGGARTLLSRDDGEFVQFSDVAGLVKDVVFTVEEKEEDKDVVE